MRTLVINVVGPGYSKARTTKLRGLSGSATVAFIAKAKQGLDKATCFKPPLLVLLWTSPLGPDDYAP